MNNNEELKSRVAQLRRKADKASGVLSEQMKRLKKEFGCNSLEEAEKLLKKLEREQEAELRELEKHIEAFEKEYLDVLQD
jgi:hypothetical protein